MWLPAIVWRELHRRPGWRPFIPLVIVAIFSVADVQKSEALSLHREIGEKDFAYSSNNTHLHLFLEPDWLYQTMRDIQRISLPKRFFLNIELDPRDRKSVV